MNANEIKDAMAKDAEGVCRYLFPNGNISGGEFYIGSLQGEAGKSMRIHLTGSKAGVWADFSSGEGGSNLLELWKQAKQISFAEALTEAKKFLGVHDEVRLSPKKEPSRAKLVLPKDMPMQGGAAFDYMNKRGISEEVIREFDIRVDKEKREIVFPYLDESRNVMMAKYLKVERTDGKKIMYTSKNTPKVLFGKHLIPDDVSTLVITEGEFDAMSYRMAGMHAVSVPFGAKWESSNGSDPNMEWIQNDYEFLERFEYIGISMDMDDSGRRASNSISQRLGQNRCRVIELPHKDANEVLLNKSAEVLRDICEGQIHTDPETLTGVLEHKGDVHDILYSDDHKGLPLPWDIPFHIRTNEVTVISGFNGSGKTMVMNYLCIWFASIGQRVCIASLEVPPKMNLAYLIRQATATEEPEEHMFSKGMNWLNEKFWFYDHVGKANPKEVLDTFAYAYRKYGVTIFVIDSFMKLGFGVDEYNKHKAFMDDLTAFVNTYDVHVFLVAHAKKKESEREQIGKFDVKGVSEMTDNAHNCLVCWRNKPKEEEMRELIHAEDPEGAESIMQSKFDTKFSVVKQRNGNGEEPDIHLWFNKHTRQYTDRYDEEGTNYVNG